MTVATPSSNVVAHGVPFHAPTLRPFLALARGRSDVGALERACWDREFPFHGGVVTTMTPALRILLGEYVIHGYDVARAVGQPWTIPDDEAFLLVPGQLMGAWVRPDAAEETYELRLGAAPPIRMSVGPRRLQVEQGTGGTPVTMAAVDFVLAFYSREPVTDDGLARLQSNFVPS